MRMIAIVEDDDALAELLTEALGEAGVVEERVRYSDGAEALRALQQGLTPRLILLDWNMPGLHGRDVLAALKADPATRGLPVVVLTSSGDAGDVGEAYALHANGYVVKPPAFAGLVTLAKTLRAFWLDAVVPANAPAPGEGTR